MDHGSSPSEYRDPNAHFISHLFEGEYSVFPFSDVQIARKSGPTVLKVLLKNTKWCPRLQEQSPIITLQDEEAKRFVREWNRYLSYIWKPEIPRRTTIEGSSSDIEKFINSLQKEIHD